LALGRDTAAEQARAKNGRLRRHLYSALAVRYADDRRQSEVIIRKGDLSDCLYLVYEGLLWVAEAGAELGPGSVIGEMGVLSQTHARTATVRAHTDCVLGRVSAQDFDRVYFANPSLGLALIRLIIDRLTGEIEMRRADDMTSPLYAPSKNQPERAKDRRDHHPAPT
jgi:CRP-like cAMP-binding protein